MPLPIFCYFELRKVTFADGLFGVFPLRPRDSLRPACLPLCPCVSVCVCVFTACVLAEPRQDHVFGGSFCSKNLGIWLQSSLKATLFLGIFPDFWPVSTPLSLSPSQAASKSRDSGKAHGKYR